MDSLWDAVVDLVVAGRGFLVIAALGLALYFLIKSMNKQLGKIEVPREDDLDGNGNGTPAA